MSFAPTLIRREASARARTILSGTGFDTRIEHQKRLAGLSPAQLRIERSITLPSTGFIVRLGDLELLFAEQDLLTGVSIYAPIEPAVLPSWEEVAEGAPPILLSFPALSADEHVHGTSCSVHASADMARGRLDVTLGLFRLSAAYLLADDLLVQIDEAGLLAGFRMRHATWTDDMAAG